MIDYAKGMTVSFYAAVVDPASWRDQQRIRIISGKTSRSDEGLRQSADLTVSEFEQAEEKWIRVWMDSRQGGSAGHDALFTGLASTPAASRGTSTKEVQIDCHSVLEPAEQADLERGWYAPAGASAGDIIKQLLECTPAPVTIAPEAPELTRYVLAEDDETHLTMVEKILDVIGWRIRINGLGEIAVIPKASEPAAVFGRSRDMIEAPVDVDADWFSCPNVFKATSDGKTAVARDDSPDSPLSTVSRGREVVMTESDCDLNSNESLEEYAIRRLEEEQRKEEKLSYKRRFDPDVTVSDLISIEYPSQKLRGTFYVDSQEIDFKKGSNVSEEVSAWI